MGNVGEHDCDSCRDDCENKLDKRVRPVIETGNITADHCPEHGLVQNEIDLCGYLRDEQRYRRLEVPKWMQFLKIHLDQCLSDVRPKGEISA